jgi:hemoglobin
LYHDVDLAGEGNSPDNKEAVTMQRFERSGSGIMALAAMWLALGCASADSQPSRAMPSSLYERLGGTSAIAAVIDQFVANVANDARINGRFATTDIARLKRNLVDQVCMATGGPCNYTGRDMKTTHAGMGIRTADFNALVQDLVAALDTFKVPETDKQELLGILGPLKKDIVERP